MLEVALILAVGSALGGFIAAVAAHRGTKKAPGKERQLKRGGSTRSAATGGKRGAVLDDPGDPRLLRELQDDVELRLRRLRRLPPGEQRRWVCLRTSIR